MRGSWIHASGGATGTSYTLVQADVGSTIRARVTGTNTAGSASAESSQSAIVIGSPANSVAPTISGTTNVGDTLTAGNGTWSGYPAPTFTYQWKRCDSDGNNCTNIAGATAGTYVIVSADQGYRLRVTVTATKASGSDRPTVGLTDWIKSGDQVTVSVDANDAKMRAKAVKVTGGKS